jgi:hypothetical protein
MPIYEYYCRDNHTVYQFFAKTLAQGRTIPPCPDNPKFKLEKMVSAFAVTGTAKEKAEAPAAAAGGDNPEDARMEAAMTAMESEFASVDENDPRAMGRMMRRMAEMTGEKIDGEMEEVVRKLEEGADPESLDEMMGGDDTAEHGSPYDDAPREPAAPGPLDSNLDKKEARKKPSARPQPCGPVKRDPRLHDYP